MNEPDTQPRKLTGISREVWEIKYRYRLADGTVIDETIEDTWRRVARAAAEAEEPAKRQFWEDAFYAILEDFHFLPGGRIIAGAGTQRFVTLFNCFVMGDVEDSIEGIFDALKESALTMQAGGGIGVDFSTLRPKGATISRLDATASGPVSFMEVWDAMCSTIMAAGSRRGAMMGVLACDHPDIERFIAAKREPGRLTNFNMSVLVTDAFMRAVEDDAEWALQFDGKVWRRVRARELWDAIMRSTYDHAEPGVIFVDTVNRENNLGWIEHIHATNPCGEQPLPPYGACLLGSVNLARLVREPFARGAYLDEAQLAEIVRVAVRLLDNAISMSKYPLEQQRAQAFAKRRIGLGITGLADALAMVGLRYGSEEAARTAGRWMRIIDETAYRASIALAEEKGPFALFDPAQYGKCGHVARQPCDILEGIARHGIRNALLTSIAPTGTISLLAGNVSSGIEPIFALEYVRRLKLPDGGVKEEVLTDYAVRLYRELKGADAPLPDVFVTVEDLHWRDHLRMQAALQAHVDSAISKTINLPEDISFEEFRDVYHEAWLAGLKGCTTYRPNPVTGAVLKPVRAGGEEKKARAGHGGEGARARRQAAEDMAKEMAEGMPKPAAEAVVPETDLSSDACDALVCTLPPPKHTRHADVCPECGAHTLVHVEGCEKCLNCDYDKCG